jgi:hypothetical protein
MNTGPRNWSAFVAQEIDRFLREFQGIEIVVTLQDSQPVVVRVHTPYMMQTVTIVDRAHAFAKLRPRHQRRLVRARAARQDAPASVRAFLNEQFYRDDGSERAIAGGRADADAIRRSLQAAVDRGLVPVSADKPHPDSRDLRDWLKRYGIGLDCSAFVQHALTRLVRAGRAAMGVPASERDDVVLGFVRTGWVYRDVTGEPGEPDLFALVPTPGEARPGDVHVKPGHIRLVEGIEWTPDGAAILHLVESISAAGIPTGQDTEEVDIGPRRLQVRYPLRNLSIAEQVPLRRAGSSGPFEADEMECLYVVGRFRALDRLVRVYPAPENRAGSGQPVSVTGG